MFEIDSIPAEILSLLREKGISEEELLLGAYCDRNLEQEVAQTYLFATASELVILSGQMQAQCDPAAKKGRSPRILRVWHEQSFDRYPIGDLKKIQIEELLSTGRLCAARKEEDAPLLLACFTNFCKESMYLFAKYANKISQGEFSEVDPKDYPEE